MSRSSIARLAALLIPLCVLFAPVRAATPNMATDGLTNDVCLGCHGNEGFEMPGPDGKPRDLFVDPKVFGASVHAPRDCVNCHTVIKQIPHELPKDWTADKRKIAIVKEGCASCHSERHKTYMETYHGQVNTLGYAYTAKCFDCHGKHDIKHVADPASRVHPNNRLQTCRTCHKNATEGFLTFQPHADSSDFAKYPHVYLTSRFMIGLLASTFAFFWLHSALWFFREWKDRRDGKTRQHISTEAIPESVRGKYLRRFAWPWRVAHLLFALATMTLTLTGMMVLYADSFWAPYVAKALGGPRNAAIVHRSAAAVFLGVFFGHLCYIVPHLIRNWKTFEIFGPRSLVPRWQDLRDAIGMFKYFFGKAPRPIFDRWTYWEKFDYWAPFWGVCIIGTSGLMMAFPEVTARFLPGWVFNVSLIAHGEEGFLAAVFLFTVHFFNNHFRPDKFPLDILMFTGRMSVEEFAHDHAVEYRRLVQTGEIQKYLVEAPSQPMKTGSKILGFTLITIGLTLLTLVMVGFFS
jgi:cytochrome b subunit of formate dehydrogenase